MTTSRIWEPNMFDILGDCRDGYRQRAETSSGLCGVATDLREWLALSR
jgi:hypothetical protein